MIDKQKHRSQHRDCLTEGSEPSTLDYSSLTLLFTLSTLTSFIVSLGKVETTL